MVCWSVNFIYNVDDMTHDITTLWDIHNIPNDAAKYQLYAYES